MIFDDALLLVEPSSASQFADLLAKEKAEREAKAKGDSGGQGGGAGAGGGAGSGGDGSGGAGGGSGSGGGAAGGDGAAGGGNPPKTPAAKKTVFFGQVELDPVKAKLQFSDVAEEVLMLFTSKPSVKVTLSSMASSKRNSAWLGCSRIMDTVSARCAILADVWVWRS